MLTSLILQLTSPTAAELPATLGRAGQALLLDLIGEKDAGLAAAIHEGQGLKPYTVSNLVLGRRRGKTLNVSAGESGWLRWTGLNEAVSRALLAVAEPPPQTVSLAGHTFAVTGATVDGAAHPWAGCISYQELAAPYLLGGTERPGPKVELEFASPTTFQSRGRSMPLPLPELVFGSLLDRWQSFAPIALHPEARRFAEETVVLSRYKLQTRSLPYKQKAVRIGFTGRVVFTALNRDRYWLNVLHLLAAFAFYSGVGYQTSAGMGQARKQG